MAARKRKRLPKNFGELLAAGDLDVLTAVFDTCDLDARDGAGGPTAMGVYGCPEALVRWLAAQGADLAATDRYGATPLHAHAVFGHDRIVELLLQLGADIEARRGGSTPLHVAADHHRAQTVRVLVEHGASVDALDRSGHTPLRAALVGCSNAQITDTAQIAELLLAAGTPVAEEMRKDVERLGRNFEFVRSGFNPDFLAQTDAGLARLYALFDVPAVPARIMHDGVSPVTVRATRWRAQHQELWNLLVPPSGPAQTVQGEVIRISGRVAHEILDNGAVNWDTDYRRMLDTLRTHLGSGTALPEPEPAEATRLVAKIRTGDGHHTELDRLRELTVHWVLANPTPVPLPPPTYRR